MKESVKSRRRRIAEIEEGEKNINNELFQKCFTNYQSLNDMYKKLRETEGERNEDQVCLIREVLNRMKKAIKKVPEDKKFMIEEKEKIINIIGNIF